MKALGRLFTAMITPFDDKGAANVDEAVRIAQFLVDRGNERTNWDHFFLRASGVFDGAGAAIPCGSASGGSMAVARAPS